MDAGVLLTVLLQVGRPDAAAAEAPPLPGFTAEDSRQQVSLERRFDRFPSARSARATRRAMETRFRRGDGEHGAAPWLRDRLRAEGLEVSWGGKEASSAGSEPVLIAEMRGTSWPEQRIVLSAPLTASGGSLLVEMARGLSGLADDHRLPGRTLRLVAGGTDPCAPVAGMGIPPAGEVEVIGCLALLPATAPELEPTAVVETARRSGAQALRLANASLPFFDFSARASRLLDLLEQIMEIGRNAFSGDPPPTVPLRQSVAELRRADAAWVDAERRWLEQTGSLPQALSASDPQGRRVAPVARSLARADALLRAGGNRVERLRVAVRREDRAAFVAALLEAAAHLSAAAANLRASIDLLEAPVNPSTEGDVR